MHICVMSQNNFRKFKTHLRIDSLISSEPGSVASSKENSIAESQKKKFSLVFRKREKNHYGSNLTSCH